MANLTATVDLREIGFSNENEFSRIRSADDLHRGWEIYNLSGYVKFDKPEAYSLTPSVDPTTGERNVYLPSAFHRLGCLKDLQTLFVQLQNEKKRFLHDDKLDFTYGRLL
ncbi:hypothetical protein BBP40_006301 [Aspergillus hancockii]|nr:hypothetical protein BBP40_006301 [Aspergillus hancockii]